MNKIEVLVIHPSGSLQEANIYPTLPSLQEAVDGYIEFLPVCDRAAIGVVDEEGLLKPREYNALASQVAGQRIYGNMLIMGILDGKNFTGVPDEILTFIKRLANSTSI